MTIKTRESEGGSHAAAPVGATAPRLFLSHNWRDKPFVERLARDLAARGVMVWLDTAKIRVGESIISKIAHGVKECDFLVVVLSSNSVKSNWVQTELRLAMTQELTLGKTKVLPLLYEDCELPPFLTDKRYADFREEAKYDESLDEIVLALGLATTPKDDGITISASGAARNEITSVSDYEVVQVGFLLYCMHYLFLAAIPIGYLSGKLAPGVHFNYLAGIPGWLLGVVMLGYGFSKYKVVFPVIALLGPTFVPILLFEARSANNPELSVVVSIFGYLAGCLWLAFAFMVSLQVEDMVVKRSSLGYKIWAQANGL